MNNISESFYSSTLQNSIAVFYDNVWHDNSENVIKMQENDIQHIISDISRMESVNYASMPSYIYMDDIQSIDDIADYLQCEIEDVFLFFRGTDPQNTTLTTYQNSYSPISAQKEFAHSLYFLASLNTIEDALYIDIPEIGDCNIVEIADICGKLSKESLSLFSIFAKWMKTHNVKAFFCDARVATSNKMFKHSIIMNMLNSNGFTRVAGIDEDDNDMISRIYVDTAWWNSLSDKIKHILMNEFSENELNENCIIPIDFEAFYNVKECENPDYEPPYTLDQIKQNYSKETYDSLSDDPVHRWRAVTGIELIHKEPTKDELERIWKNWQMMDDECKAASDKKSLELFGMNNEDHYNQLIDTCYDKDFYREECNEANDIAKWAYKLIR